MANIARLELRCKPLQSKRYLGLGDVKVKWSYNIAAVLLVCDGHDAIDVKNALLD